MMMYVEGRFQWYAYDKFLCMLDLDVDEHEEHCMNVRVLFPRNVFNPVQRVLHGLSC